MRLTFLILGLILLFGFYVFSGQVRTGFFKDTDFAVTVKIQERIDKSSRLRLARLIGEAMEGATFLASPEFSVIVIIFITIINFIKVKEDKKKIASLAISLFFALLVLGEIYGKNVVHHPAPPFFMIKNPTTIFPKYYINEEFSYPSGHAARAMFMALVLCFLTMKQYNSATIKKRLWLLCGAGIYVGLVSVSRIYLGHHWFSDIVGGWLLGGGVGLLSLGLII